MPDYAIASDGTIITAKRDYDDDLVKEIQEDAHGKEQDISRDSGIVYSHIDN